MQTAISKCEGFPMFQENTPSPSSPCRLGMEFFPKTLENLHILMPVCPRKLHYILQKYQLDFNILIWKYQVQYNGSEIFAILGLIKLQQFFLVPI